MIHYEKKIIAILSVTSLAVGLTACGASSGTTTTAASSAAATTASTTSTASASGTTSSASSGKTVTAASLGSASDSSATAYENSENEGHAVLADGETAEYDNITVNKTGSSASSDEADFYGYNAAVLAQNGATLVSNAAQGVVVEGSNSVTLTDTDLTADNTVKNSDKSDTYQAVMLYQ